MFIKHDPGPCPVDDAPHTTCTSPDYTGQTIVQLPNRDGIIPPPLVSEVRVPFVLSQMQQTPTTAFSTATYKRAIHGKHLRGRPNRR